MQYRKGTFTNATPAVAITLDLGFVPSKIQVYNYTLWGTDSKTLKAEWFSGMPDASALLTTRTTTDLSSTLQGSNGFTPFSVGADWANTIKNILAASKANPGVIQTSTNHGYTDGDIITISSVVGMTQLNTNRYKVVVKDADEFYLYDLMGNPVDTQSFGTYVSGGECNLISSAATTPLGLEYDQGGAGIIIGTAAVGEATDVMYWEAFLETPTGY